jgi:hypothetical protein
MYMLLTNYLLFTFVTLHDCFTNCYEQRNNEHKKKAGYTPRKGDTTTIVTNLIICNMTSLALVTVNEARGRLILPEDAVRITGINIRTCGSAIVRGTRGLVTSSTFILVASNYIFLSNLKTKLSRGRKVRIPPPQPYESQVTRRNPATWGYNWGPKIKRPGPPGRKTDDLGLKKRTCCRSKEVNIGWI